MAFTSDRLYIVRVDDGKAKASYPLKSVQLVPSDKVYQASAHDKKPHPLQYKCERKTTCVAIRPPTTVRILRENMVGPHNKLFSCLFFHVDRLVLFSFPMHACEDGLSRKV